MPKQPNEATQDPQAQAPKEPEVFPKLVERVERKDGSVYTKHLLADGTVVEHH